VIYTLRCILGFHACTGLYVKLEVLRRSTSPSPFTLTVTLKVLKNQVQVRDRRSVKRQNKARKSTRIPQRVLVLWAGAACCSDLGLSLILIKGRTKVGTRGPVGVSVLTIISIYTSTTLSSVRLPSLCRTCTLFDLPGEDVENLTLLNPTITHIQQNTDWKHMFVQQTVPTYEFNMFGHKMRGKSCTTISSATFVLTSVFHAPLIPFVIRTNRVVNFFSVNGLPSWLHTFTPWQWYILILKSKHFPDYWWGNMLWRLAIPSPRFYQC